MKAAVPALAGIRTKGLEYLGAILAEPGSAGAPDLKGRRSSWAPSAR